MWNTANTTVACSLAPQAVSAPQQVVDFSPILGYRKDTDEFLRLSCRDRTGWRRDEWAYSPLFIWAKFRDLNRGVGQGSQRTKLPENRGIIRDGKGRFLSLG
jgi:hypothetical protein